MSNHYSRVVVNKKIDDINSWFGSDYVITDAREIEVRTGIGKTKDQFTFKIQNPNGKYYYKYFNGTGAATTFTLDWIIPSQFLGTSKFEVRVSDLLKVHGTDYTMSGGSVISFTSAPANVFRNIRADFEVVGPDDKVTLWLWSGSSLHAGFSQLSSAQQNAVRRIDGVVTVPESNSSNSGDEIISITGVGFIESIFSGLAFVTVGSVTGFTGSLQNITTAGSAIQFVIDFLNRFNSNRQITWAGDNSVTTKGISYATSFKPAVEIIEELSADDYTGSGQFIYWVDFNAGSNAYYFHWKQKSGSVVGSIVKGELANDITLKRDVDGTINAIIYNCGIDPEGVAMEFLNFDPTVQSSSGARWKYVTSTYKIGEELIDNEFQNRTTVWDRDTIGSLGTVRRIGNYPNTGSLTTYGSMQFKKRTPYGSISSDEYNVTSKNDFRGAINIEAWARGRERTQRIIELYSNPRITGTIVEPVTGSYALGELRAVTDLDFALKTKNIRVTKIKHDIWKTELELEEDERTLVE